MGQTYLYKCLQCGAEKQFEIGVGEMYPSVAEELMEEVRMGQLGEEAKDFLTQNPEAHLSWEYQIYFCEKCHRYENKERIILDNGQTQYEIEYRCSKCKSPLKLVDTSQKAICPKCGEPAFECVDHEFILWD